MIRFVFLIGLLMSSLLQSQIHSTDKVDRELAIESVEIRDQSDSLALQLLQKINSHYALNSPNSLDSYRYRTYEKLDLDLDIDSISLYQRAVKMKQDSLALVSSVNPSENRSARKRFNRDDFEKLITHSKLFLWERAMEHRYSNVWGKKSLILDSRISGLDEPLYPLLTLRTNHHSMPKVLEKKNRGLYLFFVTDTLFHQGRETYEISFRETHHLREPNNRRFDGRIWVDAQTYGVKKIESERPSGSQRVQQTLWTYVGGKWFLEREDLEIKISDINLVPPNSKGNSTAEFGYYATLVVNYFDWEPQIAFSAADFRGYELEVQNVSGEKLQDYRQEELSAREHNTYREIDRLGRVHNLQKKGYFLSGLSSGKLRMGQVDFLGEYLLKYSKYEGLRLGLGVKLNEHFSSRWSPEAYLGYGFGDQELKYGLALDYRTSLVRHSLLRAAWYSDVRASGLFNEELWRFKMKLMNAGVNLNNEKYIRSQGTKFSWETDVNSSLTLKLGMVREENEAQFEYNFKERGKVFQESKVAATLRYSPRSQSMMTPGGKYTYHTGYPEIYVHYEQGLNSLDGERPYKKLEMLFTHQFKNPLGLTGTRLYAGKVFRDTPIWNLFQMNGLASKELETSFTLTSYLGFATMPGGRYFNDQFVGYYFTHRLPWYFKSLGHNSSSFDVLYKGVIGKMTSPQNHQLDFQTLDKLYQEIGVEWNNFLSSHFNLGFFYRIGHYQTPGFKGNFAVQLKLKLLGF